MRLSCFLSISNIAFVQITESGEENMDKIRKALSPKSAAKEDDSSSDTEQQHKTNNKVCITAAAAIVRVSQRSCLQCLRRFFCLNLLNLEE